MKAFLDTSVLVAAFYGHHERHQASIDLLLRFPKNEACCAAHSLVEVYAVLTSMRPPLRVSGDEALLFLSNVRDRLKLVALDEHEYGQVVEVSGAAGLAGGAIYDAILGRCAPKANAQAIYTWNARDFVRLPPTIASRVKAPEKS